MRIEKEVNEEEAQGMRLDKYISEITELCTRSQLKSRAAVIHVNGEEAKLSKKLQLGDTLMLHYNTPEPPMLEPRDIPLSVVYETEEVVFIDKPQGMVVHPAKGNYENTMVQALLFRYQNLEHAFPANFERPGIVHRLDKDTSGIIVVAKNVRAHQFLADQFKRKRVHKVYLAIIKGRLGKSSGRIDTYIVRDPRNRKRFIAQDRSGEKKEHPSAIKTSGKRAITEFKVLKQWENFSLVKLVPKTGRTHQLRVHMKHLGTPILGDPIYGRKNTVYKDISLMLHAWKITITLPENKERNRVYAPLHEHFKSVLLQIAKEAHKN